MSSKFIFPLSEYLCCKEEWSYIRSDNLSFNAEMFLRASARDSLEVFHFSWENK
jgi:hypothetical protein